MIPKIIHYVWLGRSSKTDLIEKCISSWKIYLPDCKIIEWNESNSPIEHPIVRFCLENKKWAFASDYIRIWALYNHGGFYFDTDIEVLQPFPDKLFQYQFVAGYEKISNYTNGALLGAEPNIDILKKMLEYLDNRVFIDSIGKMVQSVLKDSDDLNNPNFYLAPYWVFYPLDLLGSMHKTQDSLTVHYWDNSWKTDKYLFFAEYFIFALTMLNIRLKPCQLNAIYNVCLSREADKEDLNIIKHLNNYKNSNSTRQNIKDFYIELRNNYLGIHYISPPRFRLRSLSYAISDKLFWSHVSVKHKLLFVVKSLINYKPYFSIQ